MVDNGDNGATNDAAMPKCTAHAEDTETLLMESLELYRGTVSQLGLAQADLVQLLQNHEGEEKRLKKKLGELEQNDKSAQLGNAERDLRRELQQSQAQLRKLVHAEAAQVLARLQNLASSNETAQGGPGAAMSAGKSATGAATAARGEVIPTVSLRCTLIFIGEFIVICIFAHHIWSFLCQLVLVAEYAYWEFVLGAPKTVGGDDTPETDRYQQTMESWRPINYGICLVLAVVASISFGYERYSPLRPSFCVLS